MTDLHHRTLSSHELDYTLGALAMHIEPLVEIKKLISYGSNDNKIIFKSSSADLDPDRVVTADGIPILFPASDEKTVYTISGGRLIFNHDLLKSAFYLLSGYQEFSQPDLRDQWGRFPYRHSIQYRLGCIQKPLVNYYFEWIIKGLLEYAGQLKIDIRRRSPLGKITLHLTHDVDSVRYFSARRTLYRIAQAVGLRPADMKRKFIVGNVLTAICNYLKITNKKNPYWTFDLIRNVERYFGFTSTWFFLPKVGGVFDADYDFEDDDIRQVITRLEQQDFEIGLHGPIGTIRDGSRLKAMLATLRRTAPKASNNIRQHFLSADSVDTLRQMSQAGFECDCSLGFSEHEGFRFGYCHPFRPFDPETGQAMDIWEIPLQVMDVTLLMHRKLNSDEVFESIGRIADECRLFGGVFSLLWHNSTFDEKAVPSVSRLFEDVYLFLSQYSPISLTTNEIIQKMNRYSPSVSDDRRKP